MIKVMKLICLSMISAGMILAGTVTFDNLPTTQSWLSAQNAWDDIPASYAGFNWVGWEVMNRNAYKALYSDGTPIPSNPNFAYSGVDSATLSISSSTPFLFLGAQLAGWPNSNNPVASSVTIKGYLAGSPVGSTTRGLSDTGWSSSGGIAGLVDTLMFIPADRYFRMDNLEISPTPEPATMTIVGICLVGLGIIRRKRTLGNRRRSVIERKESV